MYVHSAILEVAERYRRRKVRSSSEITKEALIALGRAVRDLRVSSPNELLREVKWACFLLEKQCPPVVILSNCIGKLLSLAERCVKEGRMVEEIKESVSREAEKLSWEIEDAIIRIGGIGAREVGDGETILTHAYSLTVFTVIREAIKRGKNIRVLVTETRPEFEGRILAKKLARNRVPVTLIIDSAVKHYMSEVDRVLVGASAILSDGSVINRIGTSTIASVARDLGVKFVVVAGTYKFTTDTDFSSKFEERDLTLVLPEYELEEEEFLTVRNPMVDLTRAEYISEIITEKGKFKPRQLARLLSTA